MIQVEGLDKVLPSPDIKTIEDGVAVYRKFYSLAQEEEFKVVAIQISVVVS